MKRRGATLLELLLYCAMLGVVLTGVYATLMLGHRFYAHARAQNEAVAAALTACNQIGRSLAGGAGASFIYQADPVPACMFLSAQPPEIVFQVDSTGLLLWQKWASR